MNKKIRSFLDDKTEVGYIDENSTHTWYKICYKSDSTYKHGWVYREYIVPNGGV